MAKSENQNIEHKESWRDEFLKTICAFSNTDGGTLYIGRNDSGKTVGTVGAKKLMEDIPSKIVNMLGIIAGANLKKEKGKEFIEIKVKAYDVPISYKGKYYVRSGSTTHELNGTALHDFLLKKSGLTWDAIVEERATMKDIDPNAIEHFKELAEERFPVASKEKSIPHLLDKLHLIHNGKLTRAAILLFGKDPQRFYISSVFRIGKFKDEATLHSMDEISGNLFRQVEGAMETLKKKYLHSEVEIEGLLRKEYLEYPEPALREAIINAVMHRDYSAIHTQLKIYPDQLILWNNGGLTEKLTIEELKKKHSSYPRNELIAKVFFLAGFIDAWGSGTIRMMTECKKAGLPEPVYEEAGGGMQVTFLKDIYTEEYLRKMGLNERQIKAVLHLKEYQKINNSGYQKLNGTTKPTATRDLKDLLIKNLIVNIGTKGPSAEYILKNKVGS